MTTPHERARRQSNKDRVLAALQERPHTNGELAEIGGLRFGGRLFELRQEQWDIETEQRHGGCVVYKLRGKVKPTQEVLPL